MAPQRPALMPMATARPSGELPEASSSTISDANPAAWETTTTPASESRRV